MSSLKDVCNSLNSFFENTKDKTQLFGEQGDLGKILYSALLAMKRSDGRVGFGPREIWNISNEDLIKLIEKLEEDVRVQSKSK
jgi:hypothetical protein